MKFDIEYIEKLAKIITDNSLTEISLEDGEQAVTVRKEVGYSAPPALQAPLAAAAVETKKGKAVTSPMVGTFYKAPSPDAKPFVTTGQEIKAGDVVCIIEAMKLMNEIESEFSGKIIEICAEDGQPVEFGQTLFYVE
jgi:acetyl-CoA carboxylase biotin carboxyl carrier protein